jgi:hypothetical protein
MARYLQELSGDVDSLIAHLDQAIPGGSQAMFFKMNTFGEEAFLRRAVDAIEPYAP